MTHFRSILSFTPSVHLFIFFFNDTATTEIYTLSLHDALPIFDTEHLLAKLLQTHTAEIRARVIWGLIHCEIDLFVSERSEEHTSELQSRQYLVCRLLLEKKKTRNLRSAP